MDDEHLFMMIQQGHDEAIEQLIKKYYPDVYRYCYFKVQQREKAEDLTQETFLLFIRNLKKYKHIDKCRSFLISIAHHRCVDYFRSTQLQMNEQAQAFIGNEEAESLAIMNSISMNTYIKELSKVDQEIVILKFYYEFTFLEIAKIMNLNIATIKYHQKTSLKKLRKRIEEEELL